MSRAYLTEWAQQLCLRYPIIVVVCSVATLKASELSGLIAFLESHRALEAMTR